MQNICLPVSSRKLKIKIYKTIILPIVLYGFETWFLTQREEPRLSVFGNRMLRRIFGLRRKEVAREDCIMRIFITFTLHQILLG